MMPQSNESTTRIMKPRAKTFSDRIHDQMTFPPILVRMIDTPEFQRLRTLHQLGNCRYLFTGATHTRFEHSLGVSFLGMKFLKLLKAAHEDNPGVNPVNIDITKNDILCIGIAGLCHDLGHGPYSHLFEHFVNNTRRNKGTHETKGVWHHEDASIKMMRYLIKENNIDISEYGLTPEDFEFSVQLIQGLAPDAPWPAGNGRDETKRYLFDIVANKRNGIDVDKLDYFLRDSMSCYGKLPEVNIDRILTCARIILADNQYQICYEQKLALTLTGLFGLRARLHKFVYQHRVVNVLDQMTEDGLNAAEDYYLINLPDGTTCTLSESVENMAAYTKTGDWITSAIMCTNDPKLEKARSIFKRINNRDLYSLVGYYIFKKPNKSDIKYEMREVSSNKEISSNNHYDISCPLTPPKQILSTPPSLSEMGSASVLTDGDDSSYYLPGNQPIKQTETPNVFEGLVRAKEILNYVPKDQLSQSVKDSIFISFTKIEIGSSGDKTASNPVSRVRFYNPKIDNNIAPKLPEDQVSPLFSPQAYEEYTAFVFSRSVDDAEVLHSAFQRWFENAKYLGMVDDPVPFANTTPRRKRVREECLAEKIQLPPLHCTPFKLSK